MTEGVTRFLFWLGARWDDFFSWWLFIQKQTFSSCCLKNECEAWRQRMLRTKHVYVKVFEWCRQWEIQGWTQHHGVEHEQVQYLKISVIVTELRSALSILMLVCICLMDKWAIYLDHHSYFDSVALKPLNCIIKVNIFCYYLARSCCKWVTIQRILLLKFSSGYF